jgi:hypothetical protein
MRPIRLVQFLSLFFMFVALLLVIASLTSSTERGRDTFLLVMTLMFIGGLGSITGQALQSQDNRLQRLEQQYQELTQSAAADTRVVHTT